MNRDKAHRQSLLSSFQVRYFIRRDSTSSLGGFGSDLGPILKRAVHVVVVSQGLTGQLASPRVLFGSNSFRAGNAEDTFLRFQCLARHANSSLVFIVDPRPSTDKVILPMARDLGLICVS